MDSVELLLGGDPEELLRRDWQLLQEAGLPSQARHTGTSNAPHVTLLAAPVIPAGTDAELSGLAAVLPLPMSIAGLVIFRTRRGHVLARLGVVSAALMELHRSVHHILADVPDIAGNCLPDRWVPHITLARGMSAGQAAQALELLPPDLGTVPVAALRRWDSHDRTTTALVSG